MEREPRLLRGRSGEQRSVPILWDIPRCLIVSKLLDESEAHKRASQYRTGKGVGRGYPCFARRKAQKAVKLRAARRDTWWAFAHTLVTSQFVLGIRDYLQGTRHPALGSRR